MLSSLRIKVGAASAGLPLTASIVCPTPFFYSRNSNLSAFLKVPAPSTSTRASRRSFRGLFAFSFALHPQQLNLASSFPRPFKMATLCIKTPIPQDIAEHGLIATMHDHAMMIKAMCPELIEYNKIEEKETGQVVYEVTDKKPVGKVPYPSRFLRLSLRLALPGVPGYQCLLRYPSPVARCQLVPHALHQQAAPLTFYHNRRPLTGSLSPTCRRASTPKSLRSLRPAP